MPIPLALALPAAASLGAGLLNLLGGERANRANKQQAQAQMDFQERMSGTAYQRATADMKMAGINPMLAYMQGGASSPGGAAATMADTVGPAVSSAKQAKQMTTELDLMRKNFELDKMVKTQQAANIYTDTITKGLTHDLVKAETESTIAGTARQIADTAATSQSTRLRGYEERGLKTSEEIAGTGFGKAMSYVRYAREAMLGGGGFFIGPRIGGGPSTAVKAAPKAPVQPFGRNRR